MNSTLARQVVALEAQHRGAEVCAIRVGDRGEVEIVGTAERMTVEAFAQRYPDGLIIWWHGTDDDPL